MVVWVKPEGPVGIRGAPALQAVLQRVDVFADPPDVALVEGIQCAAFVAQCRQLLGSERNVEFVDVAQELGT